MVPRDDSRSSTDGRRLQPTDRRRPTIVVLRAHGLGGLLEVVPALRALSDAFPGHRRILAAPAFVEPLALLTGAVDDVVDTVPFAPLHPAVYRAELAVNLHDRGPQSHEMLLDSMPGGLIAFAHPAVPAVRDAPAWIDDEPEVERWCRLLREHDVAADPRRIDLHPPRWNGTDLADATLLHPGAGAHGRRWPSSRWAAVARAEGKRGRPVFVTGTWTELRLAREVSRLADLPASSILAGTTDLVGLASAVAAAGRVVSGDAGITQLASAVGTPSISLAGARGDHRDPVATPVRDVLAALDLLPDRRSSILRRALAP
jgi:glycosyl transferase family 9 (putative heptosyltransferase)